MRKILMPLAILMVVITALGAGWWLLTSGGTNSTADAGVLPIKVPQQPDADLHADETYTTDPESEAGQSGTKTIPDEAPMKPDAEAKADGAWNLRGRIVLSKDIPWQSRTGLEIVVVFLASYYLADEYDESEEIEIDLEPDGSFNHDLGSWEFGFGPDWPPNGRWQILCSVSPENHDRIGSTDAGNLVGLCTPSIQDGVIDFGDVAVGDSEFFKGSVLLTGRLIHTSGVALSYSSDHELYVKSEEGEDLVWARFSTDDKGYFACTSDLDENVILDEWLSSPWKLVPFGGQYGPVLDIDKPKLIGSRLEFGEIKLSGAIVEIELKSSLTFEPDVDGKPAFRYEGRNPVCEYLRINIWGNRLSIDAVVLPQPSVTRLIIPEGRYNWYSKNYTRQFFDCPSGMLLARSDNVNRIVIELEFLQKVPLIVTGDGLYDWNVKLDWRIKKGDEYILRDSTDYDQVKAVPFIPGAVTKVEISAEGYESQSVVVTEPGQKIEVKLQSNGVKPAYLELVTPRLPAQLAAHADLFYISNSSNSYSYNPNLSGNKRYELRRVGRWTVALIGGESLGYPNGVLAGPVTFQAEYGKTTIVELPLIPDPPFPVPVSVFRTTVLVGGAPANVSIPVMFENLDDVFTLNLEDGSTMDPRHGFYQAATDGEHEYPIELEFAREAMKEAKLKLDLPHTIEVHVQRNGQAVEDFEAVVSGDIKLLNKSFKCRAKAVDGVIRLWAPTGEFSLSYGPFGKLDTETVVKSVAGKVTRIDVELQQIQLTIDMPENDYPNTMPEYFFLPLWTLQKRSSSGIWQSVEAIKHSRAFLLDRSMYRIVPYTGDKNKIIKVDLTLGEDQTVRLPEITLPKFGSALLKFDVSIFGDDDYIELYANYSILQSSGTEGLWAPNEPVGIKVKVVPDGVRIDGVPLGVEVAIQCEIYTNSAEECPQLILNPIRIKLTKTASELEVEIIALVYTGEGWWGHPLVLATDIPGVYVNMQYWNLIPSGEREFGVIDDGQLILRRKFNIPADAEDSGPLPEDYLRKLEAHKLKR